MLIGENTHITILFDPLSGFRLESRLAFEPAQAQPEEKARSKESQRVVAHLVSRVPGRAPFFWSKEPQSGPIGAT